MKNIINILLVLSFLLGCTTGCSTITKWTSNNKKIATIQAAITNTTDKRLDEIGKFAKGTELALNLPNPTNAVNVAKKINERVQSLAPQPSLKDTIEINAVVNDLATNNTKSLAIEDKELVKLQANIETLNTKLDTLTQQQLKTGEVNTEKLSQYTGWFGLKAIFMGSKNLIMWIAIFFVLFFILKLASTASPIAGAFFSIFEGVGGMVIKTISKVVGSGAHEVAGLVSSKYKSTLTAVVGSIETSSAQAKSGAVVTLSDVKAQLNSTLDLSHKDVITDIVKEIPSTVPLKISVVQPVVIPTPATVTTSTTSSIK